LNPVIQTNNTPNTSATPGIVTSPTVRIEPTQIPTTIQLPFVDDFADGIAQEWTVDGRYAIVDGYLKNVEQAELVSLELPGNFSPNFVVSVNFDELGYYNVMGHDIAIYITVNNKFRCQFRNRVSKWQAFENNEWIDINEFTTKYTSGNVKLSVHDNNYQLFVNGEIVSQVQYGDILTGPISVRIGDDVLVKKIEIKKQ